jgi:hypothetical protein
MKFIKIIAFAYFAWMCVYILGSMALLAVLSVSNRDNIEQIAENWITFEEAATLGLYSQRDEKPEEPVTIIISSSIDTTLVHYTKTDQGGLVLDEVYFKNGEFASQAQIDTFKAHIERGKFNIH